MRRFLCGVLFAVVACGGGDSTEPEPAFPDVAGNYNMTGRFDGLTEAEGRMNGTLTLTQASRNSGALGGNLALTAQLGGDVLSGNRLLEQASVSPAGQLSFRVQSATDGISWTFTANRSGNSFTGGRHTITDGATTLSGSWEASR